MPCSVIRALRRGGGAAGAAGVRELKVLSLLSCSQWALTAPRNPTSTRQPQGDRRLISPCPLSLLSPLLDEPGFKVSWSVKFHGNRSIMRNNRAPS
ncbi:hypothetical protein AAFF_G00416360 [Aldrovandia affinis]|uniref:Uncharacterized protein n=1 Tax=Aldrovandia affinis TaxID=143900 RepID=A0AAD7WK46_9TELE|nr:hypothetical protein AAFF_G00416360 [Aldrovandia affinis]